MTANEFVEEKKKIFICDLSSIIEVFENDRELLPPVEEVIRELLTIPRSTYGSAAQFVFDIYEQEIDLYFDGNLEFKVNLLMYVESIESALDEILEVTQVNVFNLKLLEFKNVCCVLFIEGRDDAI